MRHEIPTECAYLFGLILLATARAYILARIEHRDCPGADTPCWVWKGSNDGRYGHAYFMGVRFKAHRLSYLAFRGRIPRGRVVDHKACDHTRCCSPHHTEAVTQSQNIKRCFATGRGRSPFIKE